MGDPEMIFAGLGEKIARPRLRRGLGQRRRLRRSHHQTEQEQRPNAYQRTSPQWGPPESICFTPTPEALSVTGLGMR